MGERIDSHLAAQGIAIQGLVFFAKNCGSYGHFLERQSQPHTRGLTIASYAAQRIASEHELLDRLAIPNVFSQDALRHLRTD